MSAVDLQTSPSPTRHFLTASWALTARGLTRMQRLPSIALPMVIMPVFFLVAFSGSFAGAVQVEGYGTDEAVNWMAAWAVLQGGAFSGMGAAGSAATDLENGFFDRIRLAPVSTLAVITGLLGYAVIRALLPTTAVLLVAFGLLGADMPGGFLGLVIVYVAAAGIAIVMSLMALAVAFTVKTVKALGFAQILIFVSMFLSVGQAPLVAIEGWLHDVAAVNPITRVIRMTRQGFLEPISWDVAGPGLLALAAMTVVMGAAAIWRFRAITD